MKDKIERFFEKLGEFPLGKWIGLIVYCSLVGGLIAFVGVLLYLPIVGLITLILCIIMPSTIAAWGATIVYGLFLFLIFLGSCIQMHKKMVLGQGDLSYNEEGDENDDKISE